MINQTFQSYSASRNGTPSNSVNNYNILHLSLNATLNWSRKLSNAWAVSDIFSLLTQTS